MAEGTALNTFESPLLLSGDYEAEVTMKALGCILILGCFVLVSRARKHLTVSLLCVKSV